LTGSLKQHKKTKKACLQQVGRKTWEPTLICMGKICHH